ncbi:protein LNK1-like isoform X3 [Impatiens glandulifera]|uniref:protein LNK1-like isoform X3 n=1 Tax=Impatiens glandulifera TaxID=253017 RepID=UPI001FB0A29E|nr:protein LNK1-like isoform X3 [Impatiens glandulifera]
MVELEYTFWNEFDQTEDHILSPPGHEHETDPQLESSSNKRPRREVTGISSLSGEIFSVKYKSQQKDAKSFQYLENIKNTMLENESWSQAPEGVLSASRDNTTANQMTPLAFNDARMPTHCLKSSNGFDSDFSAHDQITAVESDTYNYPLAGISPTENEPSFLDNDHDYGWPEIGNFEDVDHMFRSCDSTFGIGNGNELSWFSSVEGSEDVLNSDFKFYSESSPFNDAPKQNEVCNLHSVDNSNAESGSVPHSLVVNKPNVFHHLSFLNGCDDNTASDDELKPKELESNGSIQLKNSKFNFVKKSDLQKQHLKQSSQFDGRRMDGFLQNCDTFHQTGNLQFKKTKIPSGAVTHQVYTPPGADPDCYYYGDLSNHVPVNPSIPGARSESSSITSSSPKESSYVSNQVQLLESYYDRSFDAPNIKMYEESNKLQYRLGFQSSCKTDANHINSSVPTAACDLTASQNQQSYKLKNEPENHREMNGVSCGNPAEIDSFYAPESSLEFGLDDISLEAFSFRQLQQVTNKLDIRTKLCIRDSLYRLARSAEHRHNQTTLHGNSDATGTVIVEEANKCNGFADMESDTNPIDRSIAHLLFHRPSDSSSLMPGESHRTIHGYGGSTSGQHEETAIDK